MAESPEQTASSLGDMPFEISQIFYSRTDKRGMIQAANSVFHAISGFEWGQLLGAPHRIVRNYATPRAVFRTMWAMIERNDMAVAYVRNKTADGRGYWVIALVMPTDDGYLSVRIKPTSALFEKVKSIYAALSDAEQNHGLSIDESEARLLSDLKNMGFDSYVDFQKAALQDELRARFLQLGGKHKGYFADIDRIAKGLAGIRSAQEKLLDAVESLRDLPTNMRIVASRLEPSGGPLSAMSDIYNTTSSALFQEITTFVRNENSTFKRVLGAFSNYQFQKSACYLIDEVVFSAASDNLGDSGIDIRHEAAALTALSTKLHLAEAESLHNVERQAQDLNRTAYDLRRSMLGLDTIRVMGLVESGRLGAEGNRIGATMAQIGECHSAAITLLQGIKDNATIVNTSVEGLRLHGQKTTAVAAK